MLSVGLEKNWIALLENPSSLRCFCQSFMQLVLFQNFPSLPQSIDSEARTRVEENRHHRRQRIKQHMKHDAYNLAVVNTTMAGRLLAK